MAAAMLQPVAAQTRITGEAEDAYQNRMQWFGDAKFGVFIHWGIYAVRGVSESWSFFNDYLPYEEYMKQLDGFTAIKYNAKEWVDLIEQSGAVVYMSHAPQNLNALTERAKTREQQTAYMEALIFFAA